MFRTLVVLGFAVLPLAASAAPTPAPAPALVESKPRDGGLIDGRITAIDRQRSVIGLDATGKGRMEVDVMPSTTFESKDAGYHSITDVKNGQHVQIYSSFNGRRYVAQMIRIL